MATLSVATWIGNAAAVLSGRFGAISQRAKAADCSRQAMYNQAQRVEAAVACEQAGGPSYEALRAENEQLRSENDALWQALAEAPTLPQSKQHELASTAFAMGLSLTPIVTMFGLDIALLVGGAVITESVFNLQGLGRMAIEGALQQDLPIVLGVVLLASVAVALANLIVDVLYAFIDPRVRYA